MILIKVVRKLVLLSVLFGIAFSASASEPADGQKLFKQRCSLCHDINKKRLGPAVKSMSKDTDVLRTTITKGKKSMPKFEGKLQAAEIDSLVKYIISVQ